MRCHADYMKTSEKWSTWSLHVSPHRTKDWSWSISLASKSILHRKSGNMDRRPQFPISMFPFLVEVVLCFHQSLHFVRHKMVNGVDQQVIWLGWLEDLLALATLSHKPRVVSMYGVWISPHRSTSTNYLEEGFT